MYTRQQFYKSKQWEDFRKVIIEQRTDQDGFVHCAYCGKPILKKYDLIIHHKKELTEANVNDAMVALNPDNVECICFKCHNKEHERFGFQTSSPAHIKKNVYIIYGAPCAGKTTFVHDNATADDLIVDLDAIYQMISINDKYVKPDSLRSVVFDMRDKLYDIIKYRSGKWHNAFIITSGTLKGDRDRLAKRVSADELIFIDISKEECIRRLLLRQNTNDVLLDQWIQYINEWFDQFQPEDTI